MTLALSWFTSLLVFVALDAVWLGIVGTSFYTSTLGELMQDGFRVVPAALFYPLAEITGIIVLVLPRAQGKEKVWTAALYGEFFGLCTLRHLRPDQPGRAPSLDLATNRDRHDLGRVRHGRLVSGGGSGMALADASQPRNAVNIATLIAFNKTIALQVAPEQTNGETGNRRQSRSQHDRQRQEQIQRPPFVSPEQQGSQCDARQQKQLRAGSLPQKPRCKYSVLIGSGQPQQDAVGEQMPARHERHRKNTGHTHKVSQQPGQIASPAAARRIQRIEWRVPGQHNGDQVCPRHQRIVRCNGAGKCGEVSPHGAGCNR